MKTRAGWYMAGTCCLALLILVSGVLAITDTTSVSIDPVVYLNFNEGSGIYALDASGRWKHRHDIWRYPYRKRGLWTGALIQRD